MGDAYGICDVPFETIEDLTFRELPEDVIFKFAKAPVPAPRLPMPRDEDGRLLVDLTRSSVAVLLFAVERFWRGPKPLKRYFEAVEALAMERGCRVSRAEWDEERGCYALLVEADFGLDAKIGEALTKFVETLRSIEEEVKGRLEQAG